MSTLGLLHKVICQTPETIILLRREYAAAILSKSGSRSLSLYSTTSSQRQNYSRVYSLKMSPFHYERKSINFTTVCPCSMVVPFRQMSMLDIFRRRKKSEEETEATIVKEDGDEDLPGKHSQIFSLDEEKISLSEEEIEAKRNKSRLRDGDRRLAFGEMPYTEPKHWTHRTLKHKRRMYGTYGEKSGVDPGYLWPTKKELRDRLEYEQICNPFTIEEMVRKKQEERAAEQAEFDERTKEVESRMAMVEKFKEELFAKQKAKEDELEAVKKRREKLMEEVKRHFGYTIDSRDERFQELLEKKEKEQRKAMKEARKLEKQQKNLDKLEGKGAKSGTKEAKPKVTKVDDDDDD